MSSWFAVQTKNYATAIEAGTLWSCPLGEKGTILELRRLLKEMQIGDLVFHYSAGAIRALSRVIVPWEMSERPPGYPRVHHDDWDLGWLVRVEPADTELHIPFESLGDLVVLPGDVVNAFDR
jgi:hypothetical protein